MRTAVARRTKLPFPPPKRGDRQKGGKTFWAYKPPKELEDWLEAKCEPYEIVENGKKVTKRKYALSNFLSEYLDFYKQFEAELGSDWWEIMRRADEMKIPRGAVVAQLVKAALKRK